MRSGRRWSGAMAGLLLVLAGCGNGSDAREPDGRGNAVAAGNAAAEPAAAADATEPAPLVGTEWRLVEILGDATAARPAEIRDAVLRLDGEGHMTGRNGCNYFGGKVRVVGDRLEISDLAQTDMGCPRGGVETAFMATLRGTVTWAVAGRELRVTGAYGRGLVFAGSGGTSR